MTTRPLPSYFQGKERLETWPPLRKTVRMGTPDELAVGDRTRALDHATAGRSAEAVAYLRYVHPGNRMMIEVTFEWCLRTHIEMVHARGAAAADEAAVRTETAWRGLCGVAEGLAPTQTFQTHLSAAWLRENAVRALSSKRTRTLSIAHPALTDELEERLSEAITATEQPDRAAAVAAIERYHRHACSCHDVLIAYLWAFADTTARIAGDDAAEQMLHDAFKSTPAVNLLWPALHMLTAEDAAFALAEHMRGHFSGPDRAGAVRIVEEEDRYRLVSDPCGSGGAMRRRLQGSAMQDVAKRKAPTHTSWGEAGVPFYCMHCAHNEIRSIQTIGFPRWVTDYRPEPGKPCEWVIYKRPEDIPERYFTRIGCSRDPRRFKTTGGFLGKMKAMAGVLSIMIRAR